ncbi:MAG: hypothetical protein NVSMB2_16930 [Chloroflexota bacterium]
MAAPVAQTTLGPVELAFREDLRPDLPTLARRALAIWLPLAAAVTGCAVLVYSATQQDLRMTADDVPRALAVHTSEALNAGASPASVVGADLIDLRTSLDAYVLVFDVRGALLATSAQLDGAPPPYPTGVFDTASARGEDHVTWEPGPGVREATVAVRWRQGYVVAGRSLRLAEQHIDQIGLLVATGWLCTLSAVAVAAVAATILLVPRSVHGLTPFQPVVPSASTQRLT